MTKDAADPSQTTTATTATTTTESLGGSHPDLADRSTTTTPITPINSDAGPSLHERLVAVVADTPLAAIVADATHPEYVEHLKTSLSQKVLVSVDQSKITAALEILQPEIHGAAVLLVVDYAVRQRLVPFHSVAELVARAFVQISHEHALGIVKELVHLAKALSHIWIVEKRPSIGVILPLREAARKSCSTTDHINPIHTELFKHCILAKCYSAAVPFLVNAPSLLSPEFADKAAEALLLYFYYGGIIHIALKDFEAAHDMLSLVFMIPASMTSAIHIDAYKKLVLVSLIYKGRGPSVTTCFSNLLLQEIMDVCKHYENLSTAFSNSPQAFFHAMTEQEVQLREDGNYGLVKQCFKAISNTKIQELTETYISLSILEIQQHAGFSSATEAEARVFELVDSKRLLATIDQKTQTVSLKDDSDLYNTEETLLALDDQMQQVIHFADLIKEADSSTLLSAEYAQMTLSQERKRIDDTFEDGDA
eukprot:TRINITY_DN1999_c1_g4_i2.p1 TRINITY_DN1999_c1_g4~~TRINITY_DN1999_c1_g4_i2.p1  ORF type:complete len:480 (+),score=112.70 TRINITY_DN1999_c1_g4_i2:86-1525(+)